MVSSAITITTKRRHHQPKRTNSNRFIPNTSLECRPPITIPPEYDKQIERNHVKNPFCKCEEPRTATRCVLVVKSGNSRFREDRVIVVVVAMVFLVPLVVESCLMMRITTTIAACEGLTPTPISIMTNGGDETTKR